MIQSRKNSKSNNEFKDDGDDSNKNKNREEQQEHYRQQLLITDGSNDSKKNAETTTSNNRLMPQLHIKAGVKGDSKGHCSQHQQGPLHAASNNKVVVTALWCRGTSGNSFGCRRGDSNATTLP